MRAATRAGAAFVEPRGVDLQSGRPQGVSKPVAVVPSPLGVRKEPESPLAEARGTALSIAMQHQKPSEDSRRERTLRALRTLPSRFLGHMGHIGHVVRGGVVWHVELDAVVSLQLKQVGISWAEDMSAIRLPRSQPVPPEMC